MRRIDCQSHLFPEAYADLLMLNQGPVRTTGADGRYTIDYWGIQRFMLDLADYSLERKLLDMDASGIEMSVLSVNIPTPDLLDRELAVEGARLCNDYVAEVCAHHPDRFVGLAVLPLPDVDAAISELDRAVDDLDLRGLFLCSHIARRPLDAPEFEPLYEHVARLDIPLVLHPTVPVWGNAIADHAMIPMLGFMVDTSIAMLRLILGGVLERHPDLTVVHPHAGGVLPYLMGRVEEQTEVKGRGREHIRQAPMSYYRNVFLDLVSPSAAAIEYAIEFIGVDRVLFGSDHPWVSIQSNLALVDDGSLSPDQLEQILWRNPAKLFGVIG